MGSEFSHIYDGPARMRIACEEFPDQVAFQTPLKWREQNVQPDPACDEEKYLGERHGVELVYTP